MVEAGRQNNYLNAPRVCATFNAIIYGVFATSHILTLHSGALPQPFHTNSSIFLYHLREYIGYILQPFAQFLMLCFGWHHANFVFLPQLHNEPSPSSAVPFITILVVQNNPTTYI